MTHRLVTTVDVYSFPKFYFLLLFGRCIPDFWYGLSPTIYEVESKTPVFTVQVSLHITHDYDR
jgi:hypothetical protein